MKKIILICFLFLSVGLIVGSSFVMAYNKTKSADKVIADLHLAIERAEEAGVYDCCIEPACTMCYLGGWKFEQALVIVIKQYKKEEMKMYVLNV